MLGKPRWSQSSDGTSQVRFLHRSAAWGYALAILGPAAVVGLYSSVHGPVGQFLTAFAFLLAVLAAGMFGGGKPGLVTTGLTLVATLSVDPHILNRAGWVGLGAYFVVGVAISFLCEGLHASARRVSERQRQLEEEIEERCKAELFAHEQAERLREADLRKNEFLAMLAHELRNPLAPLSNALQVWPLVKGKPEEESNLEALMKRQVRQMTRLIDDLLDVSRITRGKIQLRPERVDVASVVTEAVESVQPFLDQCGHQLSLGLPSEPLHVNGDVARLLQIVGNVLHNAAKYTPANGEIRVAVASQGANAVLRVRDNGCGIPEAMLGRIFDMFHQVDQTLDRSHGGLGIGLTLVKWLVELHGGAIEALSDGPGKGSEFVISLPRISVSESHQNTSETRLPQHSVESLPRQRILVVDDVHESAETLSMMLQAIGQHVTMAHDGERALDWVIGNKPDVVFLDIAMPGLNGYEVARRIRATNGMETVVLAALTGYGQEDDRRRAIDAGFDFHLTKPAAFESLHEVLSHKPAVKVSSSGGTAAAPDQLPARR